MIYRVEKSAGLVEIDPNIPSQTGVEIMNKMPIDGIRRFLIGKKFGESHSNGFNAARCFLSEIVAYSASDEAQTSQPTDGDDAQRVPFATFVEGVHATHHQVFEMALGIPTEQTEPTPEEQAELAGYVGVKPGWAAVQIAMQETDQTRTSIWELRLPEYDGLLVERREFLYQPLQEDSTLSPRAMPQASVGQAHTYLYGLYQPQVG